MSIALNDSISLELTCDRQQGLRPYRVLDNIVHLSDKANHSRKLIDLRQVILYLVQASWWPKSNHAEVIQWWHESFDLIDSLPTLLQSLEDQGRDTLITSERIALAADRPFHPFAHAKGALASLVSTSFNLHWWAFHPSQLITKQASQPADLLLKDKELAQLKNKMAKLAPNYITLPMLPTQHRELLSDDSGVEGINLSFTSLAGVPTSSLRTLISLQDRNLHLKLSTNARTLGAVRSMPPRYLINGDEACRLLEMILVQQPDLAEVLTLCDENRWWVVKDTHEVSGQDLIKNKGLFGCQLRYLPTQANDQSSQQITLSSLAFSQISVFQKLLGEQTDPWQAVKKLSSLFIDTFLTLWSYGVMPECHGQNVIAQYQDGELSGFILRDHDTLRICTDRLKKSGLPIPDYKIDWSTSNSLVLESDQQLLGYFVTLGIQVNLYPIALAALRHCDHNEADFWRWIRICLEDFANSLRDMQLAATLCETLLDSKVWPFKQLLTPLLHQQQATSGMPSAMGEILNPLHYVEVTELSESTFSNES
ncbi:IucA/IucC family protein [Marinomonas sp. UCMA 3892]|nr:IucA/IucC family protein [Marinomonas sp. UCMA 3892]